MAKIWRASAVLGLGVAALMSLPHAAYAFGALAIESNHGGAVGWSYSYNTKHDAETKAMSECGDDCTVVLDFWNGCAAYSADQSSDSTVYGWGVGKTKEDAEDVAQTQCSDHDGDQCEIKAWACE